MYNNNNNNVTAVGGVEFNKSQSLLDANTMFNIKKKKFIITIKIITKNNKEFIKMSCGRKTCRE